MLNNEHQGASVDPIAPTTPKQSVSALQNSLETQAVLPVTPERKAFDLPDLTATPEAPSTPQEVVSPFLYNKKRKTSGQNSETAEELLKKARGLYDGFKEALKIYEDLANTGNAEALAMLGGFYLSGEGVKQNFKTACDYFEQSARMNHPEGMYGFANCLFNNGDDYFEDRNECLAEAVSLYYNAALKKHLPSMYKYGYCMLYGFGVDKNLDEAFKCIVHAAKHNYPEAVFELANCYYNGWGVKQDISKAISTYKKAGELGSSEAYITLGRFYDATGKFAEAIQNFIKALHQGNENAREMLQMMKVSRGLKNGEMARLATTSLQTSVPTNEESQVIILGSPPLKPKDLNKVPQLNCL